MSQLYGTERNPPIRELITNARDAIVARREADERAPPGIIRVTKETRSGDLYIHVEDNGIGMDKYFLSKSCLILENHFGIWSRLLQGNLVGLYGIGFFRYLCGQITLRS